MPVDQVVNPLEVSDEDFANMAPPVDEEAADTNDADNSSEEAADVPEDTSTTAAEESTETDADDTQSTDASPTDTQEASDATEEADTSDTKVDEPDAAKDLNYESEYKKLLAPFKANGKDIQVKNVDEAIRLMSMGANYYKKMATLKPSMKMMKLLDHHGLLDESKINYLIDLHTKNPAAITQLLKDAKIDPMDVDMSTEAAYTPQARTVSDIEMQLDDVLESIQDTEHFATTLNVITKQWDDTSRNTLLQTPTVISVINEHMGNGVFEQVTSLVARERALGNLQGLSDIEAYKAVGDQLHAQGQLVTQKRQEPTESPMSPTKPVQPTAEQVRKKKQSAAVTKGSNSGSNTSAKTPNLLAMSDEEFAALSSPPYAQL